MMISWPSLFCTGLYDVSTAIIINVIRKKKMPGLRVILVASLVASVRHRLYFQKQ